MALLMAGMIILFSSGKSGGRIGVVDQYYSQALEESSDLKNHEKNWREAREKASEAKSSLNRKISDGQEYYTDAQRLVDAIQNKGLKDRAQKMLDQQKGAFNEMAAGLRKQITSLDSLERVMDDYSYVWKIKYTLPKEKENEKGMNADELKGITREYEQLISKSEKLVN